MSDKRPHKHEKLIVEWAADTNRDVEVFDPFSGKWDIVSPNWNEELKYRFADTAKNERISSITDIELHELYKLSDHTNVRNRLLVNAAAQRAIEDLGVPSNKWFDELPKDYSGPKLISRYLHDLKEGNL